MKKLLSALTSWNRSWEPNSLALIWFAVGVGFATIFASVIHEIIQLAVR